MVIFHQFFVCLPWLVYHQPVIPRAGLPGKPPALDWGHQVHDRGPRHPPQRAQPARGAAALCAVLGHAAQVLRGDRRRSVEGEGIQLIDFHHNGSLIVFNGCFIMVFMMVFYDGFMMVWSMRVLSCMFFHGVCDEVDITKSMLVARFFFRAVIQWLTNL